MESNQNPTCSKATYKPENCAGSDPYKTIALPYIDESHELKEKNPKERLLEMLDILESHVENMRKDAVRLEEEKDNLIASLDSLRNTDSLNDLEDYDREDTLKYIERLVNRAQTVDVHIHIQRDETQEEALFQVNHFIDNLIVNLKDDPDGTKSRCLSYMNACSSHFVHGITDKKFESALLGCTLDDQKHVKRRLQGLLNYIDKPDNFNIS